MQGISGAEARQPARSVLFVACPAAPTSPLCRALVQSLAAQAPGHVIRLDPPPAGQEVTQITLHLDTSAQPVAGHLSWRAPGARTGTGPTHQQTRQQAQDDVTKSPVAARTFADALVDKSIKLLPLPAAQK